MVPIKKSGMESPSRSAALLMHLPRAGRPAEPNTEYAGVGVPCAVLLPAKTPTAKMNTWVGLVIRGLLMVNCLGLRGGKQTR
jgi:hypothetical protein